MYLMQQLFVLQTVMLCLDQDESVMAHWLDTTGQFSADRAKSVLDAQDVIDKVWTILALFLPLSLVSFRDGKQRSHDCKYRSASRPLKYLTY